MRIPVLAIALAANSLAMEGHGPDPTVVAQLARRGEATRFVDGEKGLAIVAARCGESDDPPPTPRRACGDDVPKALAGLSRDLRRRLREEGARVTCNDRECRVMGTSEYDSELHLAFDASSASLSAATPRLIGWFEVCFASAGADLQERQNRRRLHGVRACPPSR